MLVGSLTAEAMDPSAPVKLLFGRLKFGWLNKLKN